jgi:hypothetical protein
MYAVQTITHWNLPGGATKNALPPGAHVKNIFGFGVVAIAEYVVNCMTHKQIRTTGSATFSIVFFIKLFTPIKFREFVSSRPFGAHV